MKPYYKLDENDNPITCGVNECDFQNRWHISSIVDIFKVSTVFLCIDHSFDGGAPVLFETMIFKTGSYNELYMERYTTKADAIKRHNEIVELLLSLSYRIRKNSNLVITQNIKL